MKFRSKATNRYLGYLGSSQWGFGGNQDIRIPELTLRVIRINVDVLDLVKRFADQNSYQYERALFYLFILGIERSYTRNIPWANSRTDLSYVEQNIFMPADFWIYFGRSIHKSPPYFPISESTLPSRFLIEGVKFHSDNPSLYQSFYERYSPNEDIQNGLDSLFSWLAENKYPQGAAVVATCAALGIASYQILLIVLDKFRGSNTINIDGKQIKIPEEHYIVLKSLADHLEKKQKP